MIRFAWPVATRIALDQRDDAAVDELLAQLPAGLPGLMAPGLRARRALTSDPCRPVARATRRTGTRSSDAVLHVA